MEIKDVLDAKFMILDLKSKNKPEVVEELIKPLAEERIIKDRGQFFQRVMEREKQSSTGIGMGIAIPHGKSEEVIKASVVFGKSQEGIDYEALDGELSYIFFLIAVPENSDNAHLKVLSLLSRKLMDEEIRKKLMEATNPKEVMEAFS